MTELPDCVGPGLLVVPAGAIEDYSTGFGPYVFEWGEGKVALALGFGSLYNHSYRPNAPSNRVVPSAATSASRSGPLRFNASAASSTAS